jgi:ribosomal protein S18 acetylase RimI-like enzyme
MKLRKATPKDLKTIAEIFRIESAKPPYNKERTPKKALEIIKEDFKGNDMYVAIVDNKIVGFVMVKIDSGIKNQLWINELWILKEHQGQGIGKKIVSEIENIYKKKGIKIFKLVADTRKGGAYSFYNKLKYKVDKTMVFMKKRMR